MLRGLVFGALLFTAATAEAARFDISLFLHNRGTGRGGGRKRVVVMAVIDNLTKGASGQGVQIMNIMHGLPEQTGLENLALIP